MKLITQNEGKLDRFLRLSLGLALLLGGYLWLTGTMQVIAYIVASISIFTGVTGFCGLYKVLGITTCPRK